VEYVIVNVSEAAKNDLPENRWKVTDVEIDQIKDSLEGLRYGAVQIIVQDGVIVQIDRAEKQRLRRPDKPATNAVDAKR
jgi:hypothetical protein